MKKDDKAATAAPQSALIFELDDLALGARAIRYEILKGILQEQGLDFPEALYLRQCLRSFPAVYMPALLESMQYTTASAEQVVKRLVGETTSRLMQKDAAIRPDLVPWLDAARDRHFSVVGISLLPSAESIAQHLDFARWNTRVFVAAPTDKSWQQADLWMRAAKTAERSPKNCLAVTSSEEATKGALAAGMNVLAVPDAFTDFQDFGGANAVCDSLKDLVPGKFFDELSL
jgi:beta-phosphoglucomutase-like phosphatase (HAD superfamily)